MGGERTLTAPFKAKNLSPLGSHFPPSPGAKSTSLPSLEGPEAPKAKVRTGSFSACPPAFLTPAPARVGKGHQLRCLCLCRTTEIPSLYADVSGTEVSQFRMLFNN